MAYADIALLAGDADFSARVTAAYSVETLGDDTRVNSPGWAASHAWDIASAPGFGEAYASALAGSVPRPGNDPSVISDNQILAAVQAAITADAPTP